MIRFATPKEQLLWDDLVLANPDKGNLLQGYEFGQQKATIGWKPRYIIADKVALLVLERRYLFVKHWYIPKGPGVIDIFELERILPHIWKFARSHEVTVLTLDPELPSSDEVRAKIQKMQLVPHYTIQANVSTRIMDVSGSLRELLAALPQKARYAIKRAERDGVTIRMIPTTSVNCNIMFNLMIETAGGRYKIYDLEYYKAYWQRYAKRGGKLFFAYADNKVVAGAYVHTFGGKGMYKDGASVRDRSVYGASHLLQWHIIMWLKEQRITTYDLCGAPPANEGNNKAHRLYGVGLFKASFAPETTEYIGTFDAIIQPYRGKVWHRWGERLVAAFLRRGLGQTYY